MSSNMLKPEYRDGERIRRGAYPEFTIPAILVGWFLGGLIAISIAYASLKLGFSIEGSELAAILGWGILRGLMRRTSIAENNINQTIASAVNGASSGIMFSVPAIFILGKVKGLETVDDGLSTFFGPSVFLLIFACITGAFIGLAFVIPLRKQMIDFDRLPYPGGIAVATILKSPGAGTRKAVLLLGGAAVSAIAYFLLFLLKGDEHNLSVGKILFIPTFLNITFFLSLMTIGVGFLSGKGGFWFGAGGFICYWLLAPALSLIGPESTQQILHPPVRTAVVSKAGTDLLEQAVKVIEQVDANQAAQLRSAVFAERDAKKPSGDATQPVTNEQDAKPEPPTFADLLAKQTIAQSVIQLLERLEAIKKQFTEESTNRPADDPRSVTITHLDPATQKDAEIKFESARIGKLIKKIEAEIPARQMLTSREQLDKLRQTDAAAATEIELATTGTQLLKRYRTSTIASDYRAEEKNVYKHPVVVAGGAAGIYESVPGGLRSGLFRPAGIGMLVGAALGGILIAFPLIRSAFGSLIQARKNRGQTADAGKDEIPILVLIVAVLAGLVVLVFLAYSSVEDMSFGLAIAMALLGTVWVWIAGVIVAECIGRTNWSPLSGMTLIAITILILIAQTGLDKPQTVVSCIFVGAAICLAISQASDMMLDLKSGYLIGAIPRRQQIAQFVGAWLGPFIVIALLIVLSKSYTFGSDDLPAAQANALATTINGLIDQDIPIYRYGGGAILGFALAISGLGGIGVMVALGFYMPFAIVLTYTIGCLIRMLVDKFKGKAFSENVGIPIAAGLIVGEALVGVGIAIYKIFVTTS